MGKTTLARAVFIELLPGFSGNCSAYVEVGREPGSAEKARKTLLAKLGVNVQGHWEAAEQISALEGRLQRSSTPLLLVLDNVANQQDLRGLLPCAPPPRSRVLLTSRRRDLAPPGSRSPLPMPMPGLEGTDALRLFRSHALEGGATARPASNLEVQGGGGGGCGLEGGGGARLQCAFHTRLLLPWGLGSPLAPPPQGHPSQCKAQQQQDLDGSTNPEP
jgi:hypothetical protein